MFFKVTSFASAISAGLSIGAALKGNPEIAACAGGAATLLILHSFKFAMEEVAGRTKPHAPEATSPTPQAPKPLPP